MRALTATVLLSFGLSMAPAVEAQDPGAAPTYGNARLEVGFLPDPHRTELTAGGSIEVALGSCSYGFVAEAPDLDLYYTGNGSQTLYIYVNAGDDTTLLINMPNGSWMCNDDGLGNRNPIIVVPNAPSGLYDIWVGTYSQEMVRATLFISEINPR